MPVSHLGLTVSYIPGAVRFYLDALQPLGYRYISSNGDHIALGVDEADFYLIQADTDAPTTPNHIAFSADDRVTVRRCYTAGLEAGGRPSGAPGYRDESHASFNAAVEDLDGNTIEFICREPNKSSDQRYIALTPPSVYSANTTRRRSVSATSTGKHDVSQSFASRMSRAQMGVQAAAGLASMSTNSRQRSQAPAPGISRSRTEPMPVTSACDGKKVFGTLLGAAAGVAVAYAVHSTERSNARDELVFNNEARARFSSHKGPPPARSRSGSYRSNGSNEWTRSHPPSRRVPRAIEHAYDGDDDAAARYVRTRRSSVSRSKTNHGADRAAWNEADLTSSGRHVASTIPMQAPSSHRRLSHTAPTSRRLSRRGSLEDGSELDRHDSGVSMHSHRSHRPVDAGCRTTRSTTSTIKPARNPTVYDCAADVPLPDSRTQSYVTVAGPPLSTSKTTSRVSAAKHAFPRPCVREACDDLRENDSDGLGDTGTVVPDDSISCVDFSSRGRSKTSSRQGSRGSRMEGSRADQPRARKGSSRHTFMALPVRRR